jgi:NADPH-dependent ferric siderophore reductase
MKRMPMQKRILTQTTVIDNQLISPSVQRVTLRAKAPFHFGQEVEGGYVKLLFTPLGGTDIDALPAEQRPIMRTYTLRELDIDNQTVVIDFVRHSQANTEAHGLAAPWAETAQKGDNITFAGPGLPSYPPSVNHDWLFYVADMTSLPALSVLLRSLPADAKGYAVIKILHDADQQHLQAPSGVKIIWVSADHDLTESVKQQVWLAGKASVWCACEFDTMRALRHYFRDERAIEKEDIYLSSYWKQGVTEDGHKTLKRQDAESIA